MIGIRVFSPPFILFISAQKSVLSRNFRDEPAMHFVDKLKQCVVKVFKCN